MLLYAIQKSDMDLRRTLFSNVVLSGGSTLFKGLCLVTTDLFVVFLCVLSFSGFGDRLLSEMKKAGPNDMKIRVRHYFESYDISTCLSSVYDNALFFFIFLQISAPQERLYSTWIG